MDKAVSNIGTTSGEGEPWTEMVVDHGEHGGSCAEQPRPPCQYAPYYHRKTETSSAATKVF
jgi:hypothetical protein